MAIKDDDPYRLWVYSLKGEALMGTMLCSVPPDQWKTCGYSSEGIGTFMEYAGWPLKMAQGCLSLNRMSGGNPDYKWHASISREVFGPLGSADDPSVMRESADGPDAVTCLSRLWLLVVENISREARANFWEIHFRKFMRHVACHSSQNPTTPPRSSTD